MQLQQAARPQASVCRHTGCRGLPVSLRMCAHAAYVSISPAALDDNGGGTVGEKLNVG